MPPEEESKPSRPGRPRLPEARRRVPLRARVSPDTLARLQVGAAKHGLSVGEFIDLLTDQAARRANS